MKNEAIIKMSSYNKIDPEDPIYQKELIRPAEVKEDFKLMEQRKRVTNIMHSKVFKKNLENIYKLNNLHHETEGKYTSTSTLVDISEQLLFSAMPKYKIENLYRLSQKEGVICINDLNNFKNLSYGKQERFCRCKLASVFRLLDIYGWNNTFYTMMTVRPFSDREQFLVNPFGLMSHEITASTFISMDFQGKILDFGSTVLNTFPNSWFIHSAIYCFCREVRCILHLRSSAAMAVSSINTGILPLSPESIILGNVVILNNLSEILQDNQASSSVLSNLKDYFATVLLPSTKVLIMPNNGILICGNTIEESWHLLTSCQDACDIQLKLGQLDIEDLFFPIIDVNYNYMKKLCSTNVSDNSKHRDSDFQSQWSFGELEFEALMRYLDNNGYRSGYFYRQDNIYQKDQSKTIENNSLKEEILFPSSHISVLNKNDECHEPEFSSLNANISNMFIFKQNKEKWFNTPNSYKLIEENLNLSGQLSEKKSSKWISTKISNFNPSIPQRPVTAGAYVAFGSDILKSDSSNEKSQHRINPRELKENQKRVKNKYYHETNTAGPISSLLDSKPNYEDIRRRKNSTPEKNIFFDSSDQCVTVASKAVIQRGYTATVYKDLYKPVNPFENITVEELEKYRKEVDRKLNPNRYTVPLNDTIPKTIEKTPEIVLIKSLPDISMKQNSLEDHSIVVCDEGVKIPEKIDYILTDTVRGTLTSETSGADFSYDEGNKKTKSKKKKRRFKLPSFIKKEKSIKN